MKIIFDKRGILEIDIYTKSIIIMINLSNLKLKYPFGSLTLPQLNEQYDLLKNKHGMSDKEIYKLTLQERNNIIKSMVN